MMRIIVPGEPVAKQRPRLNRKTGNVYTPRETQEYEDAIAWMAKASGQKFEKGWPLAVELDFYCSPKPRAQTIDTDNAVKSALDGVAKAGVIEDVDVVDIRASRWLAEGGNARTEITMRYVIPANSEEFGSAHIENN